MAWAAEYKTRQVCLSTMPIHLGWRRSTATTAQLPPPYDETFHLFIPVVFHRRHAAQGLCLQDSVGTLLGLHRSRPPQLWGTAHDAQRSTWNHRLDSLPKVQIDRGDCVGRMYRANHPYYRSSNCYKMDLWIFYSNLVWAQPEVYFVTTWITVATKIQENNQRFLRHKHLYLVSPQSNRVFYDSKYCNGLQWPCFMIIASGVTEGISSCDSVSQVNSFTWIQYFASEGRIFLWFEHLWNQSKCTGLKIVRPFYMGTKNSRQNKSTRHTSLISSVVATRRLDKYLVEQADLTLELPCRYTFLPA